MLKNLIKQQRQSIFLPKPHHSILREFPSIEKEIRSLPPLDVKETSEYFIVSADLPGYKRENIDIRMNGNLLTISGHWKDDNIEEGTWHQEERHKGRFSRSVQLDQFLDPSKIKASMKEGVLHIKLPKEEDLVSTKIPISGEEITPDVRSKQSIS